MKQGLQSSSNNVKNRDVRKEKYYTKEAKWKWLLALGEA